MSSGSMPLPEPMLTQIFVAIWCLQATMGYYIFALLGVDLKKTKKLGHFLWNVCPLQVTILWFQLSVIHITSVLWMLMAWCFSTRPSTATMLTDMSLCLWELSVINGLTHLLLDNLAGNFQTTFSNAFSSMEMFEYQLKFHWSLFLRVQLTIIQHWFK